MHCMEKGFGDIMPINMPEKNLRETLMMFLCLSWRNILISLTAVIGKPSFSFSRRTFTRNHVNDLDIELN